MSRGPRGLRQPKIKFVKLKVIAKLFDVSVGGLITELHRMGHLEKNGSPSAYSFSNNLVQKNGSKKGVTQYVWNKHYLARELKNSRLLRKGTIAYQIIKKSENVFNLIQESERISKESDFTQDVSKQKIYEKLARFNFLDACDLLTQIWKISQGKQRARSILMVVQELRKKEMGEDSIRRAMEFSGVSWSEIEVAEISSLTPKVSNKTVPARL